MAKIRTKIRQDISQLLDVLIPENRWQQYIDLLDRDGIPSRKQLIGIFMLLCQHVETLENTVEDLSFEIELLQGSKPAPRSTGEGFKLRSDMDVITDLEAQKKDDTKAFYVSSQDWAIMEKSVDLELAKTKPEYGYGKETNPISGKEETCLYYKDLPVFRSKK